MNDFFGFNPEAVTNSLNKVKDAYGHLIGEMGDNMQKLFVDGMGQHWACEQAVKFFQQSFKPAIDDVLKGADMTFDSVAGAMNSGAQDWAQKTQEAFSNVPLALRNVQMNVGNIRNEIAGNKGIDLEASKEVVAKLSSIAAGAKDALTEAVNGVQNCGFIGGDQQANLTNSLNTIKQNIDNALSSILDETKKSIDSTLSIYKDTAGKIAEAFNGQ